MNLIELRDKIDKIDSEINELLQNRMKISRDVSLYKENNNIPVLNINRELDVISNITNNINDDRLRQVTENIYFNIMNESRGLQKNNEIYTYGLLGESLKHSISPAIHNTLFKYNKKNENYGIFEIDKRNLKLFVENSHRYSIKGFQVTIPYKIEIMQYLDEIDEVAKKIGSVNTIKIENGKKIGYNTDYFGFSKMLEINEIDVENKNILILGNGGSSKTCKYYCEEHNAKNIYIISRTTKNINENILNYNDVMDLNYDIIINTTPVGMYPEIDKSPLSFSEVQRADCIVDLVYNPKTTKLLEYAKNKKCISGLNMLFAQALKAEELWGNFEYSDEYLNLLNDEISL